MLTLLFNPAQIITVNTKGKNYKRGIEMSDIAPLTAHSILLEDDLIKNIIPNSSVSKYSYDQKIDLTDKIILPGLIECHTHSVFAGSRADEFNLKLRGISYEEIGRAGGGILKTVKAVRESSFIELLQLTRKRVNTFIYQGITTLEIKSGYGLDFENEIKLLQIINILNEECDIDIIPTFLGAHTIPFEYKNDREKYVRLIIEEMIPFISKNNLAFFCDAFCESTAFTAEEINLIFKSASNHGLKLKLHTEQFNNIGGLAVALNNNAVSVDHLEVLRDEDLDSLSDSDVVCDLLPGVSYSLDYQFAPARKLIDRSAIVALATDYNPGSSPITNISLIMSLAAVKMKMTAEEIISAYTINAAKSLCIEQNTGSIESGKKADFAVFDTSNFYDLIYNIGKNLCCMTIKDGRVIYQSNGSYSFE